MAADTVGLLDALGFEKAHVVSASMGGAIAQTMAIEHPDRVRSLTSMISTTGNRSVGPPPSPDVLREVFGGPPATTRVEVLEMCDPAKRVEEVTEIQVRGKLATGRDLCKLADGLGTGANWPL
jgi:pimeloyl-ACP methyl ester carboxylesterase